MTITVHTKPDCQQCVATIRKLDKLGLRYVTEQLTDESAAKFKRFGHMSAPVVITPEESWSGFRPDKIETYFKKVA